MVGKTLAYTRVEIESLKTGKLLAFGARAAELAKPLPLLVFLADLSSVAYRLTHEVYRAGAVAPG